MKKQRQWTKATRRLFSIVLTLTMVLGICMPVYAETAEENMSLAGSAPYNQGGGSITTVNDPVYDGTEAVLVSERANIWEGMAWSIPADQLGDLATNTKWTLSMWLRTASGTMNMSYNLEFWYSEEPVGRKYLSATASVSNEEWTNLVGEFEVTNEYLAGLHHIVIYPLSGDGELNDYYIDAVSLTGAPLKDYDDMSIAGCEPYNQGEGAITTVTDPVYAGKEAVLASGRAGHWEGMAWSIPAESLGYLLTNTEWTLSMWLRTATKEKMMMSYNLEFWYSEEPVNRKYLSTSTDISEEWTNLVGVFDVPGEYLAGLHHIVIYPLSGESELGDYYIDAVSLTGAPSATYDDMSIVGCEPYNQGGTSTAVHDMVYRGKNSVLISNRANIWEGMAWSIPADKLGNLGVDRKWTLSMWLRTATGTMNMSYNLEFWYTTEGVERKYLSAAAEISSDEWTNLIGEFVVPDEYFEGLDHIVIYPLSGDGELNDYYIDVVSLTGESTKPRDDMTVGGSTYFVHGDGTLSRTGAEVYVGNDSLMIDNRSFTFSGAGWVVTDYLKQEGWGDWYFSAYAKSAGDGEAIALQYNIMLQFEDGTQRWLNSNQFVYLSTKIWQQINVDTTGNTAVLLADNGATEFDFDKLTYAVLYPITMGGMGAYYIDDVKLWREEPKKEEETTPPVIDVPVDPTEPVEPTKPVDDVQNDQNSNSWIWISLAGVGVVCAVVVVVLITKKNKK